MKMPKLLQTSLNLNGRQDSHLKTIHRHRINKITNKRVQGLWDTDSRWWQQKLAEIQSFVEQRGMRNFFPPLRKSSVTYGQLLVVWRKQTPTVSSLTLRRSHIKILLNDHSETPDYFLSKTPHYFILHLMSLPPSFEEMKKTIKRIKADKAPVSHNISLELIILGGPKLKGHLPKLILKTWVTKTAPGDFHDTNIVTT